MATIYLVEQNSVLRKTSGRLRLCKKYYQKRKTPGVRQADVLMEWPGDDIEHIMVFGNIQITTQAMHYMLKRGVETALFSLHGHLLGQVTPPAGRNIMLRSQQYSAAADPVFCLEYAKGLVKRKINDQYNFIIGFRKNHPSVFGKEETEQFIAIKNTAERAETLDALRGHEGAASAHYFSLLGRVLPEKWSFGGRSRLPPKYPPNAVLSFAYTIIYSELWSLLDGAGFDPYLGFYHQIQYGRQSLALDLLELFRIPLADRLMQRLFNLSILNEMDFETVGKGGVYLSISGKKKFFIQYH
ncbi:CRISPR-associated endonuclease Cas1 [bacterium]|nr:CRISPR-associated endonuclease Cas1 [bacterium]